MSTSSSADEERGVLHVPWEGSFVAFSIDATATLQYYCQGGDVAAKEAIEQLVCKQYAGYCTQWYGFPDQDAAYNRIGLRLVQIGLTKPRPNRTDKFKHTTADMCVPILPATEHPLGRTPLPISKPLPWPNCYQTTMDDFDVLMMPEALDYSKSPVFSPGTDFDISCFTSEDAKRALVSDGGEPDSESIQNDDYAPDISDDVDAVEDIFFSSTDDPMWNKIFTPAVKVNPDLGVINVLSDPGDLWDEHAALKKVIDECKARRRAGSLPPDKKSAVRTQRLHGTHDGPVLSRFSKLAIKLKRARSKIVHVLRFKAFES
ncbi:hypothetical protein BDZ89DRAFT_1171094 [Hymenopellis radicata]|nr:hypothetical protein BDZ89DRAFT_1171094 [Hymenopellis radicata]